MKYSSNNSFRYDLEGEITVIPNSVIFPIALTTKEKTNVLTLASAKKIFEEVQQNLGELKAAGATLDLGEYSEHYQKNLSSILFGNKEKNYYKVDLNFNLKLSLKASLSYWDRAQLVSQTLDFLKKFVDKYKEAKNIDFHTYPPEYCIEDKEEYRLQLVETIYQKAFSMANFIGEKEKKRTTIQKVNFEQHIDSQVLNLTKAVLSMKSYFEFTFSESEESKKID